MITSAGISAFVAFVENETAGGDVGRQLFFWLMIGKQG
jgi:hypothetical protein